MTIIIIISGGVADNSLVTNSTTAELLNKIWTVVPVAHL